MISLVLEFLLAVILGITAICDLAIIIALTSFRDDTQDDIRGFYGDGDSYSDKSER